MYIGIDNTGYWTGDADRDLEFSGSVYVDDIPADILSRGAIGWKSCKPVNGKLLFDEARYRILKAAHDAEQQLEQSKQEIAALQDELKPVRKMVTLMNKLNLITDDQKTLAETLLATLN